MNTILEKKFSDFDSNVVEFNIRTIDEIRKRAGHYLSIPKRFNFYKIVYVTNGAGSHRVDMQNHQLTANTILPINRNAVQCFSDASKMEGFVVHFSPKFFIKERENFNYLFNSNVFLKSDAIECSPTMSFILNQLKSTYENGKSEIHYRQIINYLRVFFLEIEMNLNTKHTYQSLPSDEIYRKFQKAIEKNVTYKTKVKDICIRKNIAAKRLNQSLKTIVGKSAKELIDEKLVMEIKRLLLYSNYSIKEIAYKLQFDEAANLTNYFKRHTGSTPNHYRNK